MHRARISADGFINYLCGSVSALSEPLNVTRDCHSTARFYFFLSAVASFSVDIIGVNSHVAVASRRMDFLKGQLPRSAMLR